MYGLTLNTPAIRGVLSTAATAAALWYTKPAAFFDPATGQPLVARWNNTSATVAADVDDGQSTILPWYAASALVGAAVVLISPELF